MHHLQHQQQSVIVQLSDTSHVAVEQVIVAYLLATILVPDLVSDGSIPRWLHAVCAAAVFMYMHLVSMGSRASHNILSWQWM